jgi:hypothetical protein
MTEPLDPGAYVGNQPELEEESIPGRIQPADERVAAYDSRPGVKHEPEPEPEPEPADREKANRGAR